MPITESWYAQGLGINGSAGWNKYGSVSNAQFERSVFTIDSNGLEAEFVYGEAPTSNLYTWHGLTPDTVFGSYNFRYRMTGTFSIVQTSFVIATDGNNFLWARDEINTTEGKRGVALRWSSALGSNHSNEWTPDIELAGVWTTSNLGIKVKHLGDGTWQGSFSGTVGGAGTTMVITGSTNAGKTFLPLSTRHGLRISATLGAGGQFLWQSDTMTLPYTNCEWTSPSKLFFVGTWDAGSSVGYYPLGSYITECSDVVDYAYMPLEYRGWSSSLNVGLADYYNTRTSLWEIRDRLLGRLTGTLHGGGLLVLKQQWNGSWTTLFTGHFSEQPVYDYAKNTCQFSAESTISQYSDKLFDIDSSPWVVSMVGNWSYMRGLGTYSISALDSAQYHICNNGDLLRWVDGTSLITIKEIISREFLQNYLYPGGRWVTTFTIEEPIPPPELSYGVALRTIPMYPWGTQVDDIRRAPSTLIDVITSNAGLCIEDDATYQNWQNVVDTTFLGNLPVITRNDRCVGVLNEVCAALNTAYTINPEGRLRFFSFDKEPANPVEINLSEHYSDDFEISSYPPISEVKVGYGYDSVTWEGPTNTTVVENSHEYAMSTVESIDSRFLSSNISAIVAGYRAIRRFDGAVPLLSLKCEGSRWQSVLTGGGVIVSGAEDFLGSAAPLGGVWSVISKVYSWKDNQTTLTLMARFPTRTWVAFGSSVSYNTGLRWF